MTMIRYWQSVRAKSLAAYTGPCCDCGGARPANEWLCEPCRTVYLAEQAQRREDTEYMRRYAND